MAELDMMMTWTIGLNNEELLLTLKALGGRLREEEIEPARQLGDKLTLIRAGVTKSRILAADKLLKSIEGA
jgi:hypothetical protein